MTEPEPNPDAEALAAAARDRDAVRACHLMMGVYDEDGTVQFARSVMTALWRAQYPSDNGPGSSSIAQRLNRAGQVLGRTLAIARDGQSMIITDTAMCQFLGDRNGLISSVPPGPGSTSLPLSAEEYAVIEQLLAARTAQQTLGGVGGMAADATVDRTGDAVVDSGWVLHAEAEVIKGG